MGHYLPFRVAAALLVLTLVSAILFTDRTVVLTNRPMITYVSSVRIPTELGDMIGQLDDYGVHVRHQRSKFETMLRAANTMLGHPPRPDSFDNMTEPMVGRSVREWSFLGMPFGWTSDPGEYRDVLYVRNDWGTIYTPLRTRAGEMIDKANGRDVKQMTVYPFWNHIWGWFFVLGMILTWWLWQRGNARRREALGLID